MASSTIILKNYADANVTYSLVGHTSTGALYRDAAQSLSLPRTLEFEHKFGPPGAKGNDRIVITLKRSNLGTTSGLITTGSVKIELSIPRDQDYSETLSKDLLAQLQDLFVDANIQTIVDGIIP